MWKGRENKGRAPQGTNVGRVAGVDQYSVLSQSAETSPLTVRQQTAPISPSKNGCNSFVAEWLKHNRHCNLGREGCEFEPPSNLGREGCEFEPPSTFPGYV